MLGRLGRLVSYHFIGHSKLLVKEDPGLHKHAKHDSAVNLGRKLR